MSIHSHYKTTEKRETKCVAASGQFIDGPRQVCVKPDSIIMIDDISVGDGGIIFGDDK